MIKSIVVLVFVACANGLLQPTCIVDPIENRWPDMRKLCQDEMIYDHTVIEQAILADPEMQMYLDDASRIYKPAVPYEYPDMCRIDEGPSHGPQMVECGAICPSKIVNVTTVWYEFEPQRTTMCKVIRPWQQVVTYMSCGTKYPLVDGMDNSYQCVPEDIIRRRIAVYCPDIVPQCRKMDIDLPQHCAASKFQCRPKKLSKSALVDNLFSMF